MVHEETHSKNVRAGELGEAHRLASSMVITGQAARPFPPYLPSHRDIEDHSIPEAPTILEKKPGELAVPMSIDHNICPCLFLALTD